jgi:predicted RNase H-like nuclease (RuvC/YqgF family)
MEPQETAAMKKLQDENRVMKAELEPLKQRLAEETDESALSFWKRKFQQSDSQIAGLQTQIGQLNQQLSAEKSKNEGLTTKLVSMDQKLDGEVD